MLVGCYQLCNTHSQQDVPLRLTEWHSFFRYILYFRYCQLKPDSAGIEIRNIPASTMRAQ